MYRLKLLSIHQSEMANMRKGGQVFLVNLYERFHICSSLHLSITSFRLLLTLCMC